MKFALLNHSYLFDVVRMIQQNAAFRYDGNGNDIAVFARDAL